MLGGEGGRNVAFYLWGGQAVGAAMAAGGEQPVAAGSTPTRLSALAGAAPTHRRR